MTTLELYGHAIRRMRPHLGRLAIAIAGVLLASATEVLKPWPLKIVIDNVLRGAPLVSSWIVETALGCRRRDFGVNTISGFLHLRRACRRSRWKYCPAFDGWQIWMLSRAANCKKRSTRALECSGPCPS